MTDTVNSPAHYAHVSGVECVTLNRWMNFCVGSAWKYLFRYGAKGDGREQLLKARRCVEMELEEPTQVAYDYDCIPTATWKAYYRWDICAGSGSVPTAMRHIWDSLFIDVPVGALQAALVCIDEALAEINLPTRDEMTAKYTQLQVEMVHLEDERDAALRELDRKEAG